MTHQNISIGILISTYNWPRALELVLIGISQQTLLPQEILIADDGSGKETSELIERYKSILNIPIKHAWHEDKGFRKSIILNKAVKMAQSDYIIEIDGDILPHNKFIEDHIKNAEPSVFVQGARAIISQSATRAILEGRKSYFTPFSSGVKNRFNSLRIPFLRSLIVSDSRSSNNIKACNMAYWKQDFIAINGYDNHFVGWGWEDYEFAARLINAGIRKKRLKLAAICFHLFHELHSREDERRNEMRYNETIKNKTAYCAHGFNEV